MLSSIREILPSAPDACPKDCRRLKQDLEREVGRAALAQ
jgi:hypothetical protein